MSGSSLELRPLPLFVSTLGTARLLGALFVLMAALCWIAAGYDLGEVRVSRVMQIGLQIDARERVARTETGRLLGAAQIGCALVVATLFLPWFYHARVNVRALGVRRLRFRRDWAYLSFLVPVLNFFRPVQVMSEVWRGSDPSTDDPLDWQSQSTPVLIWLWWGLLLAWLALESLSLFLLEQGSALPRLELAYALSLLGNVCAAGSATAAYFMATWISRSQETKWRAFGDCALPETSSRSGLAA